MDYTKCNVISTDDHILEDRDFFSRWLPAKYKDQAPQVRSFPGEPDAWVFGSQKRPIGTAAIGATPDRSVRITSWDKIPTMTYRPAERLLAMDRDGVDVHTLFPNSIGFAGAQFNNLEDPGLRLACVQAYNDYVLHEWYEFSPRFIPQAIVPLWDMNLAKQELIRAIKLGHKSLVMVANPETIGMPHLADPYWMPLLETAQDLNVSVQLHIGSGKHRVFETLYKGYSPNQNLAIGSTHAIANNTNIMSDLLLSGLLERLPRIKFVSVESGLGWVPYVLELCDHQYEAQRLHREKFLTMKPSEYFRRNCYVNFWYEVAGIAMRHFIGIDNITWESDFPHPTCTYPDSQRYIKETMQGVPVAEQRKLLVDNAIRVFNLS